VWSNKPSQEHETVQSRLLCLKKEQALRKQTNAERKWSHNARAVKLTSHKHEAGVS